MNARIFLLFIALTGTILVSAKGRFWSYILMGTAYDNSTREVLRNTFLFIGTQLVTTDSTGHFEVTISGITCDKETLMQNRRCNEEHYGKLLVRRALSETSVTINSHWKRYAFCSNSIAPCGVQHRMLFVP